MNFINLNGNIQVATKTIANHIATETKAVYGNIDLDGNKLKRYEGSYEVTPELVAQVLPTKEKFLRDDITVAEIPYFETSNIFGGETVYIGSSIDGDQ